jgi:thioredoxin reductase
MKAPSFVSSAVVEGRATPLPVVVIGGGPVGLAAAAHLVARGFAPIVLEAGPAVAASVRAWCHVRLFSPWKYNVDVAARLLLEAEGWEGPPPDEHPTGHELIDRYLAPLARVPAIAAGLRLDAAVVSITRLRTDKLKSPSRGERPFVLRVRTPHGEQRLLASAVIDASGTWRTPNPLGSDGLPAVGEEEHRGRIAYGIPDVLGRDRARHAGKRTLVVGSGHSAFNAVLDLVELRRDEPATEVTWALRRADLGDLTGGGGRDQLAARGELGAAIQRVLEAGVVDVVTGFAIDALTAEAGGVVAHSDDRRIGPVDEIIGATGFRPELGLVRELRIALDSIVESPATLAPLIDPNQHSCGTVPPHGAFELAHPDEPGFFMVGMKAYGRAPTFLMLTGYEQVRSVAALLAGDVEAARDVQLVLPETGVCSTDRSGGGGGGGCCAPAPVEAPAASGCCGPAPAPEPAPATRGCCG